VHFHSLYVTLNKKPFTIHIYPIQNDMVTLHLYICESHRRLESSKKKIRKMANFLGTFLCMAGSCSTFIDEVKVYRLYMVQKLFVCYRCMPIFSSSLHYFSFFLIQLFILFQLAIHLLFCFLLHVFRFSSLLFFLSHSYNIFSPHLFHFSIFSFFILLLLLLS